MQSQQWLTEKPLPSNAEVERLIIGVMLLDNSTIAQARERLKAEDFYLTSHRRIYAGICQLDDEGRGADPMTLQEVLRRKGELEQVGGGAYIASTFDGVPRFSDIRNYVLIVKEYSALRQMIAAGHQIITAAFDAEEEASELLARARQVFDRIPDPAEAGSWHTSERAVMEWFDRYEQRKATGRPYDGFATGYLDLDEHLYGISRGDVSLIGARPGIGKTALLQGVCERGIRSPHNSPDLIAAVFSLELSADQWMMRWSAGRANIELRKLRGAGLSQAEQRSLVHSMNEIAQMRVFIESHARLTPNGLRAAVQKLQKDHPGCEVLVLIDYIQMMRGDNKYGDKRTEVVDISNTLKEIVKDYLNCYCIAAARLNRMAEGRKDKEPELADLGESNSLESDAATVLLLHRPDHGDRVTVKIEKGRFCGPGRVELAYDGRYVRFGDYVEPVRSWRDNAE